MIPQPPPIVLPPPPEPITPPARPPGRPRGSRNKRTVALEALFEGEAEAIARKAIELAKAGDSPAIKMVIDRLAPVRKGARIELPDFPRVKTLADVPAAHAFLINAVAKGRISPEEGAAIAATLDRYCSAVDTVELERRVAAIEERYASHTPD
ncbi:DUF5681 domain-containing protein [Bradyrhizobium sp. ISRA463]|uniref:DUF5681 domain-containing protein n=1 Tax=unclassified Bradyrhizobium TaxID=2631580 RepID=UPI0032B07E15